MTIFRTNKLYFGGDEGNANDMANAFVEYCQTQDIIARKDRDQHGIYVELPKVMGFGDIENLAANTSFQQ